MAVELTCEKCARTLRLSDDMAGKRVKCPACAAVLMVPGAAPATKPSPSKVGMPAVSKPAAPAPAAAKPAASKPTLKPAASKPTVKPPPSDDDFGYGIKDLDEPAPSVVGDDFGQALKGLEDTTPAKPKPKPAAPAAAPPQPVPVETVSLVERLKSLPPAVYYGAAALPLAILVVVAAMWMLADPEPIVQPQEKVAAAKRPVEPEREDPLPVEVEKKSPKTDPTPKTKTDPTPKTKTDPTPKTKSDPTPKTKTDPVAKTKTDPGPKTTTDGPKLPGPLDNIPTYAAGPRVLPADWKWDPAKCVDELVTMFGSTDWIDNEAAHFDTCHLPAEAKKLLEAASGRAELKAVQRERIVRALKAAPKTNSKERERIFLRRQYTYAWEMADTWEAYLKVGIRNPLLDARVRRAFERRARAAADLGGPVRQELYFRAGADFAALEFDGCRDPLVLYFAIRHRLLDLGADSADPGVEMEAAAGALQRSKYSNFRKYWATSRAIDAISRNAFEGKYRDNRLTSFHAVQMYPTLMGLFRASLADPSITEHDVYYLFAQELEHYWLVDKDRRVLAERLLAMVEQARPDSAALHAARGKFHILHAWDARGYEYADKVSQEGWKLMAERLAKAEPELEAAWKKDPGWSVPAVLSMTLELGQGKGRQRAQFWYKRAIDAEPDNIEARQQLLYYMEPKWYGDIDELLRIGIDFARGGAYDTSVPIQLLRAHFTISDYFPEGERGVYFLLPPVWATIRPMLDNYLAQHPESILLRTAYAATAHRCGQIEIAREHVKRLGDRYALVYFSTPLRWEEFQKAVGVIE